MATDPTETFCLLASPARAVQSRTTHDRVVRYCELSRQYDRLHAIDGLDSLQAWELERKLHALWDQMSTAERHEALTFQARSRDDGWQQS